LIAQFRHEQRVYDADQKAVQVIDIALNQQRARAHCMRGILRVGAGDLASAEQDLVAATSATEISPIYSARARRHRALLKYQRGDFAGAIDELSRVIETRKADEDDLAEARRQRAVIMTHLSDSKSS
jgi:hypothetical protein